MKVTLHRILATTFLLAATLPGQAEKEQPKDPEAKLRVVVLGAHPDDPESGCGGLIALLTQRIVSGE